MWSPCSPFAQLRSKELSKGVLCIFTIGEVGGTGWDIKVLMMSLYWNVGGYHMGVVYVS